MDSMTSIFAPALTKYTTQLLLRISEDFKIPVTDLNSKYLTSGVPIKPKVVRKPKEPTMERPMCPFLCGNKKIACKNRCIPGATGCHLHDPNRILAPKPPKEPKPPKVLKGDSLGEVPVEVPLVVLKNQVLVEEDTEEDEGESLGEAPVKVPLVVPKNQVLVEEEEDDDTSIQERLRAMLDEEDEPEDELEY